MNIRGADFVMFLVSDLRRAVTFYRDVLGLRCELESQQYQWAEFDCGNVTLALKGGGLLPGVCGAGRIALAVADVQAAFAELKLKGVAGSSPVDNGCCWHLDVFDPDGNLVILHQRADGTCGQNDAPSDA